MGVMNYVISPLANVSIGGLDSLLTNRFTARGWRPESGCTSLSAVQIFDSPRMIGLFVLTISLLLLPKFLGLVMALGEPQSIQRRTRLIVGAVIEQICSILQAPIVMSLHSRHLWEILCGKDSGWSAQRRCGSSFPLAVLLLRHGSQTIIELAITAYLVWLSSALIYWVLPLTLGLIFSVPLSALGGSRQLGRLQR